MIKKILFLLSLSAVCTLTVAEAGEKRRREETETVTEKEEEGILLKRRKMEVPQVITVPKNIKEASTLKQFVGDDCNVEPITVYDEFVNFFVDETRKRIKTDKDFDLLKQCFSKGIKTSVPLFREVDEESEEMQERNSETQKEMQYIANFLGYRVKESEAFLSQVYNKKMESFQVATLFGSVKRSLSDIVLSRITLHDIYRLHKAILNDAFNLPSGAENLKKVLKEIRDVIMPEISLETSAPILGVPEGRSLQSIKSVCQQREKLLDSFYFVGVIKAFKEGVFEVSDLDKLDAEKVAGLFPKFDLERFVTVKCNKKTTKPGFLSYIS